MPTPVKAQILNKYLEGYPNAQYLIDGFTEGFYLNFDGPESTLTSSNSISAINNPKAVDEKILKESKLGRLSGPFEHKPFKNFKCSPLALREKQNTGKYRLLHNLSFPYDENSVNFNISKDDSTVSYATIKDAISYIQNSPSPAFMAKTDISDAFRIIPIHPSNYHLTGFWWKGYYYDKCLPMGCSSSCKIFEEFSTALKWILNKKFGINNVVKILDDFLFIEDTKKKCQKDLDTFLSLCAELGVPLAPHKTVGPCNDIVFLGIGLDSKQMMAYLPKDKLQNYESEISLFLSKSKVTLRDFQSLCGKLQFATSVIRCGKAFLRRMYEQQIKVKKPFHLIRLTKETKDDLRIWHLFLKFYNGKSIISLPSFENSNTLHMWSDASKAGFGATFQSLWIQSHWPLDWTPLNIAILELYPVYVLIGMFGNSLQHTQITYHCDNQAVVTIVNNQTSKDKQIMKIVRPLILLLLKFNINLKMVHVPGVKNILADSISRFQVTSNLLSQFGMRLSPTLIPAHLQPQNFPIH